MSSCDQKYLIVGYFFNEMTPHQQQQFEHHLAGCDKCQQYLNVLATTSSAIKKHKREQPDKELLNNYHFQLKNKFLGEERILLKIEKHFQAFLTKPSISLRIAEAVVLLLIGFFIGKMGFKGSDSLKQSIIPDGLTFQSPVEQLLLNNYLQETEIVLLDVANLDPVEDSKIIFNLIQSAKYKHLLQKTILLRDQAKELENYQLTGLLNQIELILLELYNVEKNTLAETFYDIKQQMKDSHVLIEINSMNQRKI